MHVHFVGVAGTGMASVAGLFRAAGHRVTGSDLVFLPPMGPALERWGVETMTGYEPAHLDPRPDLVVVGNVCRRDNPEAQAAIEGGLAYTSMCHALADHVLEGTSPLVVAGTHGKTTTTSLCAHLLQATGKDPGFLVGGLPKNFTTSFQLPKGHGARRLPIAGARRGTETGRLVPFVVEGDEYDTAFFEKTPKFWHYRPEVAIVTSIEHDHVDIYPDEAAYFAAFRGFIERIPPHGLIVAWCGDANVVTVVSESARAPIAWYAVEGDDYHGQPPHWLIAPAQGDGSGQSFDLYVGGSLAPRSALQLSGRHNLANAAAAIAAVCQGFGVSVQSALSALPRFEGVARRQDLVGTPRGVRVYDDFAHHPTAVRETLAGLRARHREGRLVAVYEPRSATACRALHQAAYLEAFDPATDVMLAPLGRDIPRSEALDLERLVSDLRGRGVRATLPGSLDAIVAALGGLVEPGDTVVLLSNGAFGGIARRLLDSLASDA
ncbi:MAG: UDP-N-acetylmuramate:L-alanyl-gamma-D-glutamyl-meso-diaminopimelate ligase [Deltaproteobacteria bacterium]|nr:UDP-N-acetylmuramate:L-alanyl-gamma-D-glutamyl-meso-diaminopimelate ligase [Deltaproteobacteria bacterium]